MATMMREKPNFTMCFIGHVDSGKSTTVGHLSTIYGDTNPRQLKKLEEEAEKRNKGSFSYAYVCDTLGAERDRGITIKTNLIKLEFPDRTVNVMDCPGHKDFIKNMVTGAAQADCAVVIVPCSRGEFESAISGGTLKEHVLIAGVFGVKRIVIAVNKVDTVPQAEQQTRFNEVVNEMKNMIKSCHPEKNPLAVPISGMVGTNLSNRNDKRFTWWKGCPNVDNVITLEDAITSIKVEQKDPDAPLRVSTSASVKIAGLPPITLGRTISGTLKIGDNIVAFPSQAKGEVKTIEIHKTAVQQAFPGENFGAIIKLTAGVESQFHKGGNILCTPKNLINTGVAYRAEMVNIAHNRITTKYAPTMGVFTNSGPVQCVKILSAQSLKDKTNIVENPEIVQKNFKFNVILKPMGTEKFVAEPYSITPELGRCVLRDGGKIVAIGQIKEVISKDEYVNKHALPLDANIKGTKPIAAGGKKK